MATEREVELNFQLNRPQFDAFRAFAPGNTIFTGWGRGVGKSWFHRFLWWNAVAQYDHKLRTEALKPFRGVRIIVLMPTLKQFKDVHSEGILNEVISPDGDWHFLGGKYNAQTGSVRFPGGSWVKPMPASAYNSRTARGLRGDIVDCDEADDIDPEVHDAVGIPWLSENWSLQSEIIGGTPTRGHHGLWYRMLSDGRKGERLRNGEDPAVVGVEPENVDALKSIYAFHATYRDAPETVSAKAVAKAKATTPDATFKREWEADPDAGEGLIYPFDEKFHVRHPPPLSSFHTFLVGADHGDVDPGDFTLLGIQGHGNDATIWALQEFYESGCRNSTWDERAKDWRFATFWPDPSRQDRIRDWRALGINVRDVPPEVKPVRAGIGRVAEMLFKRQSETGDDWCRFYVAPGCRNLIREFGLYRRKKHPDGTFSEEPEDKNNHAMDAIRYAIAGHFGPATGGRHTAPGR